MSVAQTIGTHLLAFWAGGTIGVLAMAFLAGAKNG